MIGWSRRGEEYRRERCAWLATLTPERRQEEADYQDYVGRVWFRSMPLFFLGWMVALFLADLAMPRLGLIPVPGVRPAGAVKDDQKRTGTPGQAVRDGASLIVVGRPIRDAKDPVQAAKDMLAEISS